MRRAMKIVAIAALAIGGLMGAVAALFFSLSGRLPVVDTSPIAFDDAPPFRTWAEHDAIYTAARFPIVLELDGVRYVGALHTDNPSHPQLDEIRRVFERFEPTVVLLEGRSRLFDPPLTALNGDSEVAFTHALARRAGVRCLTLEPPYGREVAALLERWPAESVACYLIARGYVADRGGSTDPPERILAPLIPKRTNADGLRGVIRSVDDFDRAWAATCGPDHDWRTIDSIDRVPTLRQIGDDSREVRGRHMVAAIVTLANRGERVMAVVGASHVIRHEPTLRALLDADQE